MKRSLCHYAIALLFFSSAIQWTLTGQNVIFAEDFSGFSTGTHSTPSTIDASGTLDAKTNVPGWTGSLVYPAGGEIKIGTSSSPGWIETPLIDFTPAGGNFIIRFDIARWPDDATTVRVMFNGEERGSVITPANDFSTVEIVCSGESSNGKVKIAGITKRFYIDNLMIISNVATSSGEVSENSIILYPVPASSEIIVKTITAGAKADILNYHGIICSANQNVTDNEFRIDISSLPSGFYILRIASGKSVFYKRFIKSGN